MNLPKLRKTIIILCLLAFTTGCQEQNSKVENLEEPPSEANHRMKDPAKTLVVYFSETGTTKRFAKYAAELLDADIYKIEAADPYTEQDLTYYTNGRADQEQSDPSVRVKIANALESIEAYDQIVIGYPLWHGQAPRIVNTFLESYDFSDKIIIPFCTSHSSDIGNSDDQLHSLVSDTVRWREGKRFRQTTDRQSFETWLTEIIKN